MENILHKVFYDPEKYFFLSKKVTQSQTRNLYQSLGLYIYSLVSCLLLFGSLHAYTNDTESDDIHKFRVYQDSLVEQPEATAFALSSSCTNGTPNDDGYLQISAANTASTHYDFTMGSTYTGAGMVDATAFNPATDLPLQFGTLANPAAAQDYTIRVFNGLDDCFTDIVVALQSQDCAGGCDCTEMLYLNDTGTGEVHKFSVNPATGEITEIGAPWMSGFTNPHGLGADLNGNLYIGDDPTGPIYQLNSSGGTAANDATLWFNNYENGLTSMGSYENYIITNGYQPGDNGKYLTVHDACTGDVLGQICLNDAGTGPWSSDWGVQVLDDGTILATDGQGFGPDNDRAIWVFQFDPALINSATCIDAFATDDNNSYLSGVYDVLGITSDSTYLYVMTRDDTNQATILKIDANTGTLVTSVTDNPFDGVGWHAALGLVYVPSSGYLYVSGYEDCIAIVDTADLSYIGPGNGTIPSGSVPKAVAIKKECCPTINRQIIEQTYCISDISQAVFLNEIYDCEGTIGEGVWELASNDSLVIYKPCDQSITLNGGSGCATFVKSSDGVGNSLQCGAFEITMNICFFIEPDTPEIAITDNDCNANTLGAFTVTSACGVGSTIEWSTDNGTTWSTTAPAYTNANAQTVIARCVDDDNTCISLESTAVTSNPTDCCATRPCFGIGIQQN